MCLLSNFSQVFVFLYESSLILLNTFDLVFKLLKFVLKVRHKVISVVIVQLLQMFLTFFRKSELPSHLDILLPILLTFGHQLMQFCVFSIYLKQLFLDRVELLLQSVYLCVLLFEELQSLVLLSVSGQSLFLHVLQLMVEEFDLLLLVCHIIHGLLQHCFDFMHVYQGFSIDLLRLFGQLYCITS